MIDLKKIKTYSIRERKHKESVKDFADISKSVELFKLIELSERIKATKKAGKAIIFQFGGHVIKTGMSPYVIDLMKRGFISHIAVNGSVSVHDFEIAMVGETSEDVDDVIKDGRFGVAEETGRYVHEALRKWGARGYGYAVGRQIAQMNLRFKEHSIFYHAYMLRIPLTAHVAIGTDVIHQHPLCDGSALGESSFVDFKKYSDSVTKMGALLNIGSAVIMPEVFLKALNIARNLGFPLTDITTANLDMIDHYRPSYNVVERPTSLGGKGFKIIAKHQETIPFLYKLLTDDSL